MMSVIVGFVVGFVVGTKNGPIDVAETRQAWQRIQASQEFQDIITGGTMMVGQVVQQGIKGVAGFMAPQKRGRR